MIERIRKNPFAAIAILITIANVFLIWSFRFLPLYDFPIWLYEVKIMRSMSGPEFSSLYAWAIAPVPNLGFVIPVWLMSFAVPIPTAGKIFLSFCVVGLPWSFRFLATRVSSKGETPLAYAAFPFAFNIFFFGGNAFLAGIIVLFMMMGMYVPRLHSPGRNDWLVLSFLFLALYFIHALAFCAGVVAFLSVAVTAGRRRVALLLLSLFPSFLCSMWYLTTQPITETNEFHWSWWGLSQNLFKPMFLFIKSYAIENPIPLTLLNGMWLVCIAGGVLATAINARGQNTIDRRWMLAAVLMFLLAAALPEAFAGVKGPGTRFGFCMMFFLILMLARVYVSTWWRPAFLLVALLVNVYYTFHFQKVNEQMQELYADLTLNVDLSGKSFRSFRFDYPPPRDLRDVAAASIDPLFGVVSYAAMNSGGAAWIFGTSVLRYSREGSRFNPRFADVTTDELAENLFGKQAHLPYEVTIVVGKNKTVDSLLKTYAAAKIVPGAQWTIIESTNDPPSLKRAK